MTARGFHKWLVVMVKVPVAGVVKTRLAKDVGTTRATAFYRHTTAALIGQLAYDPRWRTVLAVTPDGGTNSSLFPTRLSRLPQGRGDLGQRMQRIVDILPPGPVVIIGSDCPSVTAAHIDQAFTRLGADDAVIGPAEDGGYWLIGLKRRPNCPEVFRNVRWSSADTRADTVRNLKDLRVGELELLSDVDTGADLDALARAPGRWVRAQV